MIAARKIIFGVLVLAAITSWPLLRQCTSQRDVRKVAASGTAPGIDATMSVSARGAAWDERWRRWLARLATAGSEIELATEFEELVRADFHGAFARAKQEPEPRRSSLMQTIMVLWSANDLAAAAAEARALPDSDRAIAVAAVLSGAIDRPDEAVKLAVEFCRDDPALASEHGYALIAALGRSGEFRRAIRFALESGDIGAGEDHNKWLRQAFAQWATQNPAMAMAAIQELPEPGARFEALEAISASRVRTDPQGLAETLRLLPPGADRSIVLAEALRGWVRQNPKTAADWLDRLEPNIELDAGAAAVARATQGHLQNHRPEVALSWGQSIVAPDLRSRTIAAVVQKWATADLPAARAYAEASTDLLDEDRVALVQSLDRSPARAREQ